MTINTNHSITYQPGYYSNGKYSYYGFYNKNGDKIIDGPVTVYKASDIHTGYLQLSGPGGSKTTDSATTLTFNPGSDPTVTVETDTKTFLVKI